MTDSREEAEDATRAVGAICEATFYSTGADCTHPAKYLVPYDSSLVCGIHARAFLRCIPIHDIGVSSSGGN